jgi:hypothetical protein
MVFNDVEFFMSVKQQDFTCLNQLQQQLQSIYEIDIPHMVSDFVTTDQQMVSCLTHGNRNHIREQLLLQQDAEDLDVSLYLHSGIVKGLVERTADYLFDPDNMEDMCLAIEGISHFLYLVWRAINQQRVTRLELELQAEVDKYILILSLLKEQNCSGMTGKLRTILFENIIFDSTLSVTELTRYKEANFYAAKYCWQQQELFLENFGSSRMINELRRFYRLGQNAKLNRINKNGD